jgi:hypothetical protein
VKCLENTNNQKKKCTYCGEEIDANAGRCSLCGSLVDRNAYADTDENKNEIKTIVNEDKQRNEQPISSFSYSNNFQNIPVSQAPELNNKLSNGMKVFLTVLSVAVPFLGQIAGIIIAIVYMNSNDDEDRKSFGMALLLASIIFFVLSFLVAIIIGMAALMINGVSY